MNKPTCLKQRCMQRLLHFKTRASRQVETKKQEEKGPFLTLQMSQASFDVPSCASNAAPRAARGPARHVGTGAAAATGLSRAAAWCGAKCGAKCGPGCGAPSTAHAPMSMHMVVVSMASSHWISIGSVLRSSSSVAAAAAIGLGSCKDVG